MTPVTVHTTLATPVGTYQLVAREGHLVGVYREAQLHGPLPQALGARVEHDVFDVNDVNDDNDANAEHRVLVETARQLDEYFAGTRSSFDVPVRPSGSEFQRGVLKAIAAIPYGSTRTYGQLAADLGRPRAAQAVGRAAGLNPISIVIPCHRVVGSTGSLTGYSGGLDVKQQLLTLEGALLGLSGPSGQS